MPKDSTTSAIETLRKMKGLPTMYNYGDGKRIYGMDEKLFLSVLESFESLEAKLKIARKALEWYAGKNLEGSSHIAE